MYNNKYLCKGNKLSLQKNISNICNNEYEYFLNKKNVVGVGCGYKVKNGFRTNDLCIQVFVLKKISKLKIVNNDMIPLTFKGIKTDVVESGNFVPCSLTDRVRPVLGGYSISSIEYQNYYGSAGCLVTNGVLKFMLTTNHTIANDNKVLIGAHIVQPAIKYGGVDPKDIVGALHKFIPLRFIEGEQRPANLSDCAIAIVASSDTFTPQIAFIGRLNGVKSPTLNSAVEKVGSVTELTQGIITSINATLAITNLDGSRCLFRNQIFTTRMSQHGDSGSILINKNHYAVGMLIGIGDNISIYSSIKIVLDQLDVQLVT